MGSLENAGVSDEEEQVYRVLLGQGSADISDVADTVPFSPARTSSLLASLEAKGLVTRVAGTDQRFLPVPPRRAIDALIRRQQEKLQDVRVRIEEFEKEFSSGLPVDDAVRLVEVISSPDAVFERLIQLHQGAEQEILSLSTPPYITPSGTDPLEEQQLRRGIRYRVIYSREAIELPGEPTAIEESIGAGEEARILPSLPMKLAIADRSLALMPLTIEQRDVNAVVLVHPSALLDALVVLFESLWEQAVPLPIAAEAAEGSEMLINAEQRRLIALLAAGSKDEVIARQLGVAPRTLRRRIAELLEQLGAETRFQAGSQAAKRGWI